MYLYLQSSTEELLVVIQGCDQGYDALRYTTIECTTFHYDWCQWLCLDKGLPEDLVCLRIVQDSDENMVSWLDRMFCSRARRPSDLEQVLCV